MWLGAFMAGITVKESTSWDTNRIVMAMKKPTYSLEMRRSWPSQITIHPHFWWWFLNILLDTNYHGTSKHHANGNVNVCLLSRRALCLGSSWTLWIKKNVIRSSLDVLYIITGASVIPVYNYRSISNTCIMQFNMFILFLSLWLFIGIIIIIIMIAIIKGSLAIKLPTIRQVEKQRREESEKRKAEERGFRCAKR